MTIRQTSVIVVSKHRVHTVFDDGREMIEEFDIATDQLLTRKHRKPTSLGGTAPWIWEVGENIPQGPPTTTNDQIIINEASGGPVISRRDTTPGLISIRIRNLTHPVEVMKFMLFNILFCKLITHPPPHPTPPPPHPIHASLSRLKGAQSS
jgi:hypothetical protein